jgi:hypothetical protein
MPLINPEARDAIQPELGPGEEILWAGMPTAAVIFHKQDLLLIPFTLLWGGFAIYWELSALGIGPFTDHRHPNGSRTFGIIWGVPFVLIGQYMIWGRFIYSAWLKTRTYYAVTNSRLIVVQRSWRKQIVSAYIEALPTVVKEDSRDGFGTLRFDNIDYQPRRRGQSIGSLDGVTVGTSPNFFDIEDVAAVYRLVLDLRDKSKTTKAAY